MSVLCRPVVIVPEHTISLEQTLELASRLHADHDQLSQVLSMVSNTGVQKRHLVQPIDQTLRHPGFEARNLVYVREVKARVPEVIHRALAHADLGPGEIDAIVFVSCTGFTVPSMIAWMINRLWAFALTRGRSPSGSSAVPPAAQPSTGRTTSAPPIRVPTF